MYRRTAIATLFAALTFTSVASANFLPAGRAQHIVAQVAQYAANDLNTQDAFNNVIGYGGRCERVDRWTVVCNAVNEGEWTNPNSGVVYDFTCYTPVGVKVPVRGRGVRIKAFTDHIQCDKSESATQPTSEPTSTPTASASSSRGLPAVLTRTAKAAILGAR